MAHCTASSVLVIGSGIAGFCRREFLLARAGVGGRYRRGEGARPRHRLRDHPAGQRPARPADLGVWEEVANTGGGSTRSDSGRPTSHGTLLAEIEDARTGGPDLPAAVGMERPDTGAHPARCRRPRGSEVRFGMTAVSFEQDDDGVDVHFSDGSHGRYDVVIGADGVRSTTRRALGIDLETASTGMGIWRLICSRPASITRTDLYYGGVGYIAGYCPTGETSMYAYIVEDAQDRSPLSKQEQLETMRALAEHYHGPWDEIRAQLTDPDADQLHLVRNPPAR